MKKLISMMYIFLISIMSCITFAAQSMNSFSISDRLNQFAFDIYKNVHTSEVNLVFSPYSISSLLVFLTIGSADETRNQFSYLLHLDHDDIPNISQHVNQLNTELFNNNKNSFQIANAFWADKELTYKNSFLELTKKLDFIYFKTVDFKKHPEQARITINNFISDKTHNYIKDLLAKGTVSANDFLILTNAIYFKGVWKEAFDANLTFPHPFYLENNSKIDVPTMQKNGYFSYFENKDLQVLELSYSNSTLKMDILLPKQKGNFNEFITQFLNKDTFYNIQKNIMKETHTIVLLPKFNIESSFDDLDRTIKQMGATDAFNISKANFSNLTNSKLIITKIIQKAVIQVDEKGTTAAAATAIVGIGSIGPSNKPQPKLFQADHPFVFILFDSATKIILFIGHVGKP